MDCPSVFLIRIPNGRYGFRVVAVVSSDKDAALDVCEAELGAQAKDHTKPYFARIMDSCSVSQLGNYATFEFEE